MTVATAVIFTGAILRILCTAGIAFGDRLNTKEKFFVALSWMSKATVQAALGPVALKHLTADSSAEERRFAEIVQTVAIFSIILTAPLGAILISVSGTRLLTKTKQPPVMEGNYSECILNYPNQLIGLPFSSLFQDGDVVIVLRYVILVLLMRRRNVRTLNYQKIKLLRKIPSQMLIPQVLPSPMSNDSQSSSRSLYTSAPG